MHVSIWKSHFGVTKVYEDMMNQMLATTYNEQVWNEVK